MNNNDKYALLLYKVACITNQPYVAYIFLVPIGYDAESARQGMDSKTFADYLDKEGFERLSFSGLDEL